MKEFNQKIVFVHAGPLRPDVPSGHLPRRGRLSPLRQGLPQPARSADSPVYGPNRNPMKWFRFGKEEGDCGYGAFAAPADA